jgi:hypothetical protein
VRVERACYVGDIHAIDVQGAPRGLTPVLIDTVGICRGLDCAVVAHLDELVAGVCSARARSLIPARPSGRRWRDSRLERGGGARARWSRARRAAWGARRRTCSRTRERRSACSICRRAWPRW